LRELIGEAVFLCNDEFSEGEEMSEEELEVAIASERKVYRESMIILGDNATYMFFRSNDGTLGLGYVEMPDGTGWGGAIGLDLKTELACLQWLKENTALYIVKGNLEIIKHSGDDEPSMCDIQILFSKRIIKQLTEEDLIILKAIFVEKYLFKSFTVKQVAENVGISYEETKRICGRLSDFGCALMWCPDKEKLHITQRGWEILELKELIQK